MVLVLSRDEPESALRVEGVANYQIISFIRCCFGSGGHLAGGDIGLVLVLYLPFVLLGRERSMNSPYLWLVDGRLKERLHFELDISPRNGGTHGSELVL